MKPETCVGCGATAPEADTSYTAIGHGWRVQARNTPEGPELEWRCGPCWKAAREAKERGESPPRTKSRTAQR
jgi:hypothetical protein